MHTRLRALGTEDQGNAPGDERWGTWVRVGGPAAGANWGGASAGLATHDDGQALSKIVKAIDP